MLVESCILALIGGAIGVLIGMWSTDLLLSRKLIAFPASVKVSVDGTVLAFTLAASMFTGLIFGAAPAIQIAKSDPGIALKEAARGSSGGRSRLLEVLVVAEVTLCVVLLIGAGLMIRTVRSLQHVDPGFNPSNVLRVEFKLPTTRYNRASGFQFVQELTNRVSTLPGVQRVAFGSDAPWSYTASGGPIEAEGQTPPEPGHEQIFYRHYVTTEFFSTLGISLIRGRQFTATDTPQSPSVVVISEALARRFWPGADPVGRRVRQNNGAWLSVVGVVRDVTYRGFPRNPDSHPDVYFPLAQFPDLEGVLLVKTSGSPLDLAAAVRQEMSVLDADLPAFNVTTMQELSASQTSQSRFTTWLLTIFGGLAVFLAIVGVYGVMSYSASRRTNEIGIRMTLGARQRDVMRMLILRGVLLVAAGLAAGLGLSLFLTRSMSTMLYGVTATDPVTFIVAAVATALIGAIANYIPARRATRVDPVTAMRFQ
jgi:putative ABC transport system permease protein